jgi:hypothetical protein
MIQCTQYLLEPVELPRRWLHALYAGILTRDLFIGFSVGVPRTGHSSVSCLQPYRDDASSLDEFC